MLSEGKYEITAIDLKTKENHQKLKKYHRRINVIYGDIDDPILMDSLVKEQDCILHLAGIMPPLCNLNREFGKKIDYISTENIVRAISFFHPECLLIYPSTTTLYAWKETEIKLNSKVEYGSKDLYSKTKEECEQLIKKKIKNYIIFRFPFTLGDLTQKQAFYLYEKNTEIETISNEDVAYAFVSAIAKSNELNRKTKILSGSENCRILSNDLWIKIVDQCGFHFSCFGKSLLNPYQYKGLIFKEDKELNELLHYQNDSIDSYLLRLKRHKKMKKGPIAHVLGIPYKKYLERKKTK